MRGKDSSRAAALPASAWRVSSERGKAAERAGWDGPLGSADVVHGADRVKPFRFTRSDAAVTLEVLHEMGIWTYLPVNVRLEGRFWLVTGTNSAGREVVVLEGEMLTGQMLRLAARLAGHLTVVSWGERARGADTVAREPVAVTCWVVPALTVTCSAVSAVQAAAMAGAR